MFTYSYMTQWNPTLCTSTGTDNIKGREMVYFVIWVVFIEGVLVILEKDVKNIYLFKN